MTKDEFLAVGQENPWWLYQREIYTLEPLRVALGQTQLWSDPQWYTDQNKREQLYYAIERLGSTYLTEDLNQAIDEDRRKRWLESLIAQFAPKDTAGGAADGGADSAAPTEATVKSMIDGMSADDVTRLASELGATPQQVQALMADPELAKLVTEEATRLAGG
jgi:hypothetical protein